MDLQVFKSSFFDYTSDWNWQVEGFIDSNGFIHPIDSDTKVISSVFERLASPVIRKICENSNYHVETANQTTYPDFTLTNKITNHRVALDIKTTYESRRMMLTLGGYNSFIRNNTKNILYPYNSYQEHWILGFIYKQRPPFSEYTIDNMPRKGDISASYEVKHIFVRSKSSISGLRAGSGNTKNIGSIIVKQAQEFDSLNSPFMNFEKEKEACDHYWRNYEGYSKEIKTDTDLWEHPDFLKFTLKE
jgi:Restriction endonuclease EcoRV